MKKKNILKTAFFAILIVFLLFSCSAPINNQTLDSQPTSAIVGGNTLPSKIPTTHPATTPVAKTCGGWVIHVTSVDKEDAGNGWTYLTGHLVFENVNAGIYLSYGFDDTIQKAIILSTAEGFNYSVDYFGGAGGQKDQRALAPRLAWVPPGFRTTYADSVVLNQPLNYGYVMRFKVASSTTKHVVNTPCGTLNYDQPESGITLPTDLSNQSFASLGQTINSTKGTLIFTKAACAEGNICIFYTFTNASKGYGASLDLSFQIIGADGIVHFCRDGGGSVNINIGPGQDTKAEVSIPITSNQNMKLIITKNDPEHQQEYWVLNIE